VSQNKKFGWSRGPVCFSVYSKLEFFAHIERRPNTALLLGPFLWFQKLMALFFRRCDFIWSKKIIWLYFSKDVTLFDQKMTALEHAITVQRSIAITSEIRHFGTRVDSGIFWKKTPKRTWLCAGISPLLYGLRTWSKPQKTRQVF